MARLHRDPYPGNWNQDYEITKKMFEAIPKDRIIKFSVADGYAEYFVVSIDPLVLQHIPFLDGYAISMAHLRGLRKADVLQLLACEAAMNKFFAERKTISMDVIRAGIPAEAKPVDLVHEVSEYALKREDWDKVRKMGRDEIAKVVAGAASKAGALRKMANYIKGM